MSYSHRLFAESANELMDEILKPGLEEQEVELTKMGFKPEVRKVMLSKARADAQKNYLPKLKKMMEEGGQEIKENNDSAGVGGNKLGKQK